MLVLSHRAVVLLYHLKVKTSEPEICYKFCISAEQKLCLKQRLETIQRHAALMITSGLKSSPIAILEIKTSGTVNQSSTETQPERQILPIQNKSRTNPTNLVPVVRLNLMHAP